MSAALSQPGDLLEMRLLLLRDLAESMEVSKQAMARNDTELIARGAAHQAELCRQWSRLDAQLHHESARYSTAKDVSLNPGDEQRSAQIERNFSAIVARIRYLTRVHASLLRHMQRSLAILTSVAEHRAATYSAQPAMQWAESTSRTGD